MNEVNVSAGVNLAVSGQSIAASMSNFVGPILLALIGVMAIPHLFGEGKSTSRLIGYAGMCLIVVLIFYFPGVLRDLASTIASWFGVGDGSQPAPNTGQQAGGTSG